ncbi:MAG: hypothetical protein LBL69_03470 [Zoogloeaceae bacterium]|nr:hypothetical protein [Zoogloeaceae bacterium]
MALRLPPAAAARLKDYSERFMTLGERERLLVSVAAVAVVLYAGIALWIQPDFSRAKLLNAQAEEQKLQIETRKAQISELEAALKIDPDVPVKRDLARVEADIAKVNEKLDAYAATMVSPQQATQLLEEVLQDFPGVRVAGFQTLPPEDLSAPKGKTPAPAAPAANASMSGQESGAAPKLYRHAFVLTLAGGYPDLSAALAALERVPQRLLWQKAELVTKDYPESELRLTISTLSLDSHWLEL